MSAICDTHKKVDVELLYTPGEDRKSVNLEIRPVGDQMSWR